MADKGIEQEQIDRFYQALDMRRLDICEAILAELAGTSSQRSAAAQWHAYFAAVLMDVRDNDWAAAERRYRQLLVQSKENDYLRGQVFISLGLSYWRQARWADAIRMFHSALSIYRDNHEPVEEAKVQNNLATLYHSGFTQGDFSADVLSQAVRLCESALAVLQTQADTPAVIRLHAYVWNTLGMIYTSLQQWEKALTGYQHILTYCSRVDDRYGMGIAHCNIGEIYQKLGRNRWSEARQAYQAALSIFQQGRNHNEALTVLSNLGFLYAEDDQLDTSLAYYAQAIELVETIRAGISSETARAGFFTTVNVVFANAILTCIRAKRWSLAFDYVERARSRAFLDLLETGSLDLPRDVSAETLTLAAVQEALPADALLLEYFTTGLIEAPGENHVAKLDRHLFPPAKTFIFAITREAISVHDAGLSPNALYPNDLEALVEEHFLQPAMRQALYNYLMAPFASWMHDKRRLYIVPHGPLHYVPFQALTAHDGEALARADGPHLIYAPSATILLRHAVDDRHRTSMAEPDWRPTGAESISCLAIGHNGSETDVPLRFAEEEARSIAHLTGGRALVGAAARKSTILQQAAAARWLHFSCHGVFNPDAPLESALHLAKHETLTAQEILETMRIQSPLVTLSACDSGLSRVRRGDELFGLVRAFLYAGAQALIVTQWRVDERSTRILMERFYHNMQNGMEIAAALRAAQLYLKQLTRRETLAILAQFDNQVTPTPHDATVPVLHTKAPLPSLGDAATDRLADVLASSADDDPVFTDPYYWAPFILIGDRL